MRVGGGRGRCAAADRTAWAGHGGGERGAGGHLPAGAGSERGMGAAPGDEPFKAPQEQPGTVRLSLPGRWGQRRTEHREAHGVTPLPSRVSPHPTSVTPSRCHLLSVSPPPVLPSPRCQPLSMGDTNGSLRPRCAAWVGGGMRDARVQRDTEGQNDTKDRGTRLAGPAPLGMRNRGCGWPPLGAPARRHLPGARRRLLIWSQTNLSGTWCCSVPAAPALTPLPWVPRLWRPHRPTPSALQSPVLWDGGGRYTGGGGGGAQLCP